jgi:hypothetical protein
VQEQKIFDEVKQYQHGRELLLERIDSQQQDCVNNELLITVKIRRAANDAE